MQAELFDSTRHDQKEAPAGYYAMLKAEAKPKDGSNICRACDWRHECQRPDTDFSTPGHRCMEWARNDASSVLFKRTVPNAELEMTMKYPLLPRQSIEYNVLHALEVGYTSASDIETYLRDSGKAVYPRQISGALQRLKRDGMATHKNKGERDRWKLVPNCNLLLLPNK